MHKCAWPVCLNSDSARNLLIIHDHKLSVGGKHNFNLLLADHGLEAQPASNVYRLMAEPLSSGHRVDKVSPLFRFLFFFLVLVVVLFVGALY